MSVAFAPRSIPSPVAHTARAPLSRAERWSAGLALAGVVGLGAHGFAAGAHNTVGYLVSVVAAATALAVVRREPLRPGLALGLGVLVVGHLAGGLVDIGDDVLYNTHPNFPPLQYDHVFHASASALGTLTLWTLVRPQIRSASLGLVFAALGALGLGLLVELVEFLSTLAHDGGHVGGYLNTGWDFVSNTLGVSVACILVARQRRSRRA